MLVPAAECTTVSITFSTYSFIGPHLIQGTFTKQLIVRWCFFLKKNYSKKIYHKSIYLLHSSIFSINNILSGIRVHFSNCCLDINNSKRNTLFFKKKKFCILKNQWIFDFIYILGSSTNLMMLIPINQFLKDLQKVHAKFI